MTWYEVKKALSKVVDKIVKKMINRTPVKTGKLKNSYRVSVVREQSGQINVSISNDATYAVYQDEGTYNLGPAGGSTYRGPFGPRPSPKNVGRVGPMPMGIRPKKFGQPWNDLQQGFYNQQLSEAFKKDLTEYIKLQFIQK